MKKVFEKTAYWVGVLTLGIVVGVTIKIVGAWVEPNQMPPGGNIAAPLNTGNIGQAKQGGLTLNIGGATYGLIVDKGLVGIGTTAPGEKLEVNGNIKLSGDVSGNPAYKITNLIAPTGSSDAATKGYVDAAGGGASSDSLTANGGLYSNKIIDMTPPNAYTEICIKDGTIKYDIHNGSNSTQGGNCVPGDIGYIIEKNLRSKAAWFEAKLDCAKNNMRLPEILEWQYSCVNSSMLDLSNMPGPYPTFEWASNFIIPMYWSGQQGANTLVAGAIRGSASCAGANQDQVGAFDPAKNSFNKNAYRCVR